VRVGRRKRSSPRACGHEGGRGDDRLREEEEGIGRRVEGEGWGMKREEERVR